MDVAVTGSGGLIGQRLVAALAEDAAVDRVVALDVAEQRVPAGVAVGVADVRDPAIADQLAGVDALVHLAFQLDPIHDEEAMRQVNVEGTRTTLTAAVEAGVQRIVLASSATIYGAHPDNDVPLTESSPRRPPAEFSYARHKGEVEDWLWGWVGDLPDDVTVTVLRPAIVAGAGVDNFITRQLELPRLVTASGHHPPLQVVHVDDVVAAFQLAATTDMPGAYNVAAPGWLSLDEALAVLGRGRIDLPEEVAWGLAAAMWRLGVGDAPAAYLPYIMHPWVVDVRRLEEAGWTAHHSNRDALAALAAEHGPYVRVGPLRVRREQVAWAATAAVGMGTLALAARIRRRLAR